MDTPASSSSHRTAWWEAAALAALLAAGGWLLLHETRGTTFYEDEWSWILTRRGGGLDTLLTPHNQHLSLIPVALYKLLFAIFGLRHYSVFRACLTAAQLGCVTLVFIYARGRVGAWLALLAAAVVMFFGPGWQDILWPFQIAWVLTVVAGVGALMALDWGSKVGDICACLLLAVALASASPGLAVAVGLIVEVVWRRPRRDLWIVGVPVALYVVWWLGYQQSSLVDSSLLHVPGFVADSAAGVLSSLTGLAKIDVPTDTGTYLDAGPTLVFLGLGVAAGRLIRLGHLPPRVLTLAVIPFAFWIIVGVGRANTRIGGVLLSLNGDEGRYIYIGAVWTLLLFVELARGVRAGPWALGLATLVTGAVVLSNLGTLRDGGALLRTQAQITEAEIGTLDMTRSIIAPSFASNGFVFFTYVTARGYFVAERQLGTPAAMPAQIAAFGDPARAAADAQLIRIHSPTLTPVSAHAPVSSRVPPVVQASAAGTYSTSAGCVRWRPANSPAGSTIGAGGALDLVLPARGVVVRTSLASAAVSIRRFASDWTALGALQPSSAARLRIGPDLGHQPWQVEIASPAPLTVTRPSACVRALPSEPG